MILVEKALTNKKEKYLFEDLLLFSPLKACFMLEA